VERSCEACDKPFEAKHASARFCSDACRKRAKRRGGATATPPAQVAAAPAVAVLNPDLGDGLVATTIAALRDANRLNTWRGQLALKAAGIVDASNAVMGMAALMKDFDRAMEAALAGAVVETDAVDEVERKRQEKLKRLGIA
jgi:hypothetical protein